MNLEPAWVTEQDPASKQQKTFHLRLAGKGLPAHLSVVLHFQLMAGGHC